MSYYASRYYNSAYWSSPYYGEGGPSPAGGGGAVPEEMAFSIRNQRVSNHAAAARRSVIKPGHLFSEDDAKRIGEDTAREFRKRMLDAEQEEEAIMLLLALGFE